MCKAFVFLHSLEDARYAARALGLPIELVPQAPIRIDAPMIRVDRSEELENAYHRLCENNSTGEFTAIRR